MLIGDLGEVRFAKKDRTKYAKYFAKAGINISTIKTVDQFNRAWELAKPYFMELLDDVASDGDMSNPERRALVETLRGNNDRANNNTSIQWKTKP